MKQSVEQFYEELADCLHRYLSGGETEVVEMNMLRLKVRIDIAVSLFMDVFYAVRTQKFNLVNCHLHVPEKWSPNFTG